MSRNFDGEIQDNSFRDYNYGFDVITRRFLLQEFSRNFDANAVKVLEVGSYDGSMTEQILGYFEKVDVVEASSKMAQAVQEKFGHRVCVHGFPPALPFARQCGGHPRLLPTHVG